MTRWRDKKNPFKNGDLVICEAIDGNFIKAVVTSSSGSSVQIDPVDTYAVHWVSWRQCKKLKPKEKKYKITKKQLAKAWDKIFGTPAGSRHTDNSKDCFFFKPFCEELGIE